ncbi:hypothetical protein NX059_007857 [Plenodomus lindquistii]|nr:hypothetical protein NX059_007857 [Plenodomus lindquistii]
MAYRPIENSKDSNTHVTDIELSTRYAAGSYGYVPAAGKPSSEGANDIDTKDAFRTDKAPVQGWPICL